MDKPRKLKRSESFFGLHFDFHASPEREGSTTVGSNTTIEMVEHIINAVNPDYLQCDCKGHPGYTSYPTKAGEPFPDIVGDPLKIWREATEKHNVGLYVHYSGVSDNAQSEKHPEWQRVKYEGEVDSWNNVGITSTFGPYVDELLIPQFRELAGEYKVDGVWVDGECWATHCDYHPDVMQKFYDDTGIDIRDNPPKHVGDENWFPFAEFCREQFRSYLGHYVDTIHNEYPDFQIASNWAYSSRMPEPVGTNVDFISGDYTPSDSVNSARFEGRCIAPQGKPWDLMAWGFRWRRGMATEQCVKHSEQLKQEAAAVLMLGGGFQCYFAQRKDGSVILWQVDMMKSVAEFCRERQAYCHKAVPVPQVALLNSTTDYYRHNPDLFAFGRNYNALEGILYVTS